MTLFFSERFIDNNDDNWTNVEDAGGPITVINEEKRVQDGGVSTDVLGFYGKIIDTGVTLVGKIVQCDLKMERDTIESIGLVTINKSSGLDYVNGLNFNYNSFPSPVFNYFDYGGFSVVGSDTLDEFGLHIRYTLKFKFESDGTVTAYISRFPGIVNFLLGTSIIATDFVTGPVYFSVNQTFTNPSEGALLFDNIFVHDEGLSFSIGDR